MALSVESMRRIDRWVGVPLCALATFILKFKWRLWPRPPRPVRRILFIELSEMGSAILAEPAMRKARERTGAEDFFVIFAKNADSLAFTGTIAPRNVFTIRTESLLHVLIDSLIFLIWTRRNAIDTVVDFELFSRMTALMTGLSGADRRIGFYRFYSEGLYRGEMLTHRVAYNPHHHIAKNFLALVNALLGEERTIPNSKKIGDDELWLPSRAVSAIHREKVKARIELLACRDISKSRLILINPNASEMLPQRRWMADRYANLIRHLLATSEDVLVMITGASSDRANSEKMAMDCASSRCVSLAGHLALTDLPALYSLAELMVTNDSGPAHFAAVSNLPTVVLFGPETPCLYRPLQNSTVIYAGLPCSPCVSASNHRRTACRDNVCMRAIGVDEVFDAVMTIVTMQASQAA